MRSIILVLLCATPIAAQTPRISANDNRTPAGILKDGVLKLNLEIAHGMWYPDREDDPGVDVLTFAEPGHKPQIPGPLVRVPVGTEIRTTVHNASDSSVIVIGLSGQRGLADSVRVNAGETRDLSTIVPTAGTYMYRALTRVRGSKEDARIGSDMMLGGALIVDDANSRPDRVLVLFQWLDSVRLKPFPGANEELLTINGKAWPNTERLDYNLGDTIRWRVVNASMDTHPMHLHGAYFTVLDRGTVNTDTAYAPAMQRSTVTERMAPLTSMNMQWIPVHAGNWAFHCHLTFHILPHPPLGEMKASETPMLHGMGGLVLGTTVHGPIAADTKPRRQLRVVVEGYDSVPGDFVPPFSYEHDNARGQTIPAPPIIVQRGEPIAITVVNHTKEATSVHWHGLEIESYYDGVPLFGGDSKRITPLVAGGDSFVVKMTPPRVGTFIYHNHADEVRQQGGGMYGAFIVLNPGEKWDADHERIFLISTPRNSSADTSVWVNGPKHPESSMKVGETYRLRLINITLDRPSVFAQIMKDGKLVAWNLIARDGADLPASQRGVMPAKIQPITIGQTYDALFTPIEPGTYTFEVRRPNGFVLAASRIEVR